MRTSILLGVAALLVAAAWYTRTESRRISRRHPPRGRRLPIADTLFHVRESGDGEPVVLLHGNAVTSEDWIRSGLFDTLAEERRVIAPDRPGYGHSQRRRGRRWTPAAQAHAIARLLRAMNATPAVIVAHSLGTQVALRLALDHPDCVSSVVLVSGYYFPTLRPDSLLTSVAAAPLLGDFIRSTIGAPIGRASAGLVLRAMFAPAQTPPDYERDILETSFRPSQMGAACADGLYMLFEAAEIERRLPELDAPVTIIAGEEDRVVSVNAQSRRLAQALPHATLHVLPGLGHMLHHDAQETIVAAVRSLSARAPHAAKQESRAPDLQTQ